MMPDQPVEVSLVVSGVNLDDDDTLERIADHLDDLLWTETSGMVLATVFADADAVPAALNAATRITQALPHATVTHVDPDLVTITTIAERTGVSRQAVRKWVLGQAAGQHAARRAAADDDVIVAVRMHSRRVPARFLRPWPARGE